MRGLLRKKLVVMVTNQIQYLDHASSIVCLNRDGTATTGSLVELSRKGKSIEAENCFIVPCNTGPNSTPAMIM